MISTSSIKPLYNAAEAPCSLPWSILCDFDGTISFADVTDTLLETFGKPGWRELETRWLQGEIGSYLCMSGQIALLDVSKQELDDCLSTFRIDPCFAEFCDLARSLKIPLKVVSDGLDYAINTILNANDINGLPVLANHLRQVGPRHWALSSPWSSRSCLTASGTCKCAIARAESAPNILMIGDGRSDLCVSQIANHIFAKSNLISECQRLQLPYTAITDFSCASIELPYLVQRETSSPVNSESVVHNQEMP